LKKIHADIDDLKKEHGKILMDSQIETRKFSDSLSSCKTKMRKIVEDTLLSIIIHYEKQAQALDLAIMIDCTGSMASHIEMAKSKLESILNNVKETYTSASFRVAIIGYRDYSDNKKRFEIRNFGTVTDAVSLLKTFKADGGGDGPEDINGAFQ